VHVVHLVARIALGVVFVVAGGSKVASGRAWPAQAAQLDVPHTVAIGVPWLELIVGALVAVGVVEPWPVVAALVLLVLFTAVLVRTLRTGRRPPCACFGTWTATPVGWSNVWRNAAFLALAVVVLVSS
jgi:uncharacterized membrane protein YphA (DoxX/SURF4 family)